MYTNIDDIEGRIEIEPGDLHVASLEALKAIVDEHQYRYFTWPNDEPEDEPLLIDAFTASAMMKIYDALNLTNQERFRTRLAKSRVGFGILVNFTWEHIG